MLPLPPVPTRSEDHYLIQINCTYLNFRSIEQSNLNLGCCLRPTSILQVADHCKPSFFSRLEYAQLLTMSHRPITSAFRNAPPLLLTPFSSLPLPRAAASRCSQSSAIRSISSSSPHKTSVCSNRLYSFSFQRPLSRFPNRLFSSSARRSYGFGNQPYKRFGDPRRQPLIWRLLANARPIHFVMIGLGISGFYLYNTEVVEVRLDGFRDRHYHYGPYGTKGYCRMAVYITIADASFA